MPFLLTEEQFFIPKQGRNALQILPSWRFQSGEDFYLEVPTHYQVTPECRALICRGMNPKLHCPVEDYIAHLVRLGHTYEAERMQARSRYMLNVYLGGDTVKVWSISDRMLQDILSLILDGAFAETDRFGGYNLTVYRSGEGSLTRYTMEPGKSLTPPSLTNWKERVFNLDTNFAPPSIEECMEILKDRF